MLNKRLNKLIHGLAKGLVPHDLYRNGDNDAPEVILDRNGQVALSLCRACGRGESELHDTPYCDVPDSVIDVVITRPSAFARSSTFSHLICEDKLIFEIEVARGGIKLTIVGLDRRQVIFAEHNSVSRNNFVEAIEIINEIILIYGTVI